MRVNPDYPTIGVVCEKVRYVDCHPNGLRSNVQLNPYTTGRTSNTTSNGDPMDLSWAVNKDGSPKQLDAVRYVRVYTGVQQMNGIMGESSTEVLGSHRAVKKGDGAATVAPTVAAGVSAAKLSTVDTTNMGAATVKIGNARGVIKIESSAEHIFVNGEAFTSGETLTLTGLSATAKNIQIITQNGTEAPYVTVLNVIK